MYTQNYGTYLLTLIKLNLRQDLRFNSNLRWICTDYKYFGVIFSRNRHFHQTKKHNI